MTNLGGKEAAGGPLAVASSSNARARAGVLADTAMARACPRVRLATVTTRTKRVIVAIGKRCSARDRASAFRTSAHGPRVGSGACSGAGAAVLRVGGQVHFAARTGSRVAITVAVRKPRKALVCAGSCLTRRNGIGSVSANATAGSAVVYVTLQTGIAGGRHHHGVRASQSGIGPRVDVRCARTGAACEQKRS